MATDEVEHPGVPRVLLGVFAQFLGWGVFWTGALAIYSLGALLVALVVHPELLPFVAMAMATLVIHVVGKEVRGEMDPDSEDSETMTRDRMWLYATVMYVLAATAVGVLLLWSAGLALLVADGLGRPVLAIVVAFVYPVVDQALGQRAWSLSVASISMFMVARAVVWLFRLRNVSTDLVETAERQARAYY